MPQKPRQVRNVPWLGEDCHLKTPLGSSDEGGGPGDLFVRNDPDIMVDPFKLPEGAAT
jgi:hypothetical protein